MITYDINGIEVDKRQLLRLADYVTRRTGTYCGISLVSLPDDEDIAGYLSRRPGRGRDVLRRPGRSRRLPLREGRGRPAPCTGSRSRSRSSEPQSDGRSPKEGIKIRNSSIKGGAKNGMDRNT